MIRLMIAARASTAGVLLAGWAAIAFFSGGYFDRARLWAGVGVWVCVAFAALVGVRPWPRTRGAWLALGGLGALTAWTILSIHWAPLRDQAQADAQRTVLYLGMVLAGTAVLRERNVARAVEPALAFGALIVIVEGLSERLLPGVFTLTHDLSSGGRLSQPITYWNAMGIVAAMGFVLLVRIAGDPSRSGRLRLAAATAGPAVALGLYLTLSRGGLLATAIGLVLLARLVPTRDQLQAVGVMVIAAVPAIVASAASSGVRTLQGSLGSREGTGLVLLCLLAASMAASIVAMTTLWRRRSSESSDETAKPTIKRAASAVCVVIAVVTAALFITAAASRVNVNLTQATDPTSARLVTTDTVRGNFWAVAMSAFVHHAIRGVGAGGFETEWERHRTLLYYARDAHSLYVETLSELGIVGALTLLTLIAGVVACARRAYRLDPGLSAGWIAALSMWAVHAGLDWDWEMPAVSLFAFALVAAVVARADVGSGRVRASAAVAPEPPIAAVSSGLST